MKKLFIIISYLICQLSFCQVYNFDNFLEFNDKNNSISNYKLINSNDNTYYLSIDKASDSIYGALIDSKREITHFFKVIPDKSLYNFNYLYSKKINTDNYNKKLVIESSKTLIDSTLSDFKIIVFSNKRKKSVECEIEIQVEKSDFLFNNYFIKNLSHGRITNSNFYIDKGILKYYKILFRNGFEIELKLKNIKLIKTRLVIKKVKIK